MANTITTVRIICCIVLLFFPAFSAAFYIFYIIAGVSDMIDGTVARKTKKVTELGAKLDTFADFIMVSVCIVKIIPVLHFPIWLMVWVILIAIIKAVNIISGYIVLKKIVAIHTVMNKLTGLLLFLFPLTLTVIDLKYSGALICVVATFSAIQDGLSIKTKAEVIK